MKKKILTISFIAVLICLIISITNSVLASEETTPKKGEDKLSTCFFANGTPITISERTDKQEGATITWVENGETKSENVEKGFTIFGGSHAADVQTTSITMNGGTVANIFGGGLHKSTVNQANITINGGTVTSSVLGGSANYFLLNEDCKKPTKDYYGDANKLDESITKVEKSVITINGGTIDVIFGGGESYSYTGNTEININSGNINYVVGSGSNGYTNLADVNITGGSINVYQSVNRGEMITANVDVSGGSVGTFYIGAEPDGEGGTTGTINNVGVKISEGAKVGKLEIGNSGSKEIGSDEDLKTTISIDLVEGTVEEMDKDKFKNIEITEYVIVKIENEKYKLEKGKTLSDLDLEKYKNVEGKKFISFVLVGTNGKVITEIEPINENIDIFPLYEEVENETSNANEQDETPKTGVVDVVLVTLVVAMVSVAGIVTVKKHSK